MPAISLRPTNGASSVRVINCGYSRANELNNLASTPGGGLKGSGIGGSLDVKQFTNLQQLICIGNDIVECTGWNDNPNITLLDIWSNSITGQLPTIDNMTALATFRVYRNLYSGLWQTEIKTSKNPNLSVINLSTNSIGGTLPKFVKDGANPIKLANYVMYENKFSGAVPDFSDCLLLNRFQIYRNELSGEIETNQDANGYPDWTIFQNLTEFQCYENLWVQGQAGRTGLTGKLPIVSKPSAKCTGLKFYECYRNAFTENLPSLTGLINLEKFLAYENSLTGSIPDLIGPNGLGATNKLTNFRVDANQLTGTIPELTGLTALKEFYCGFNSGITGSIPNLGTLSSLEIFSCSSTAVTDLVYNSGNTTAFTIPPKLGSFSAYSTDLSVAAIDAILKGYVISDGLSSSAPLVKLINITGVRSNASTLYPSFTNTAGAIQTVDGDKFSKSGTTVTVNQTGHGYATGDMITITSTAAVKNISGGSFVRANNTVTVTFSGHGYSNGQVLKISDDSNSGFPTAFITNNATVINATLNTFQYTTTSSGTLTGSGTATITDSLLGQVTATSLATVVNANQFTYTTASSGSVNSYSAETKFVIRKPGSTNDGYYAYQQLTLVGRPKGVWNVAINHPNGTVTA